MKNCVITNDNGSGISSQNGRMDLNNTLIQGNPGFGIAYWTGGKTYMQYTSVENNTQMGLWLNSSTAYANLTPDGISPGYNVVQNNTHNQINIFSGGAFLGDSYLGNPRGGQNTVKGNCALIYNGTSTTVSAQYTRWNSCP